LDVKLIAIFSVVDIAASKHKFDRVSTTTVEGTINPFRNADRIVAPHKDSVRSNCLNIAHVVELDLLLLVRFLGDVAHPILVVLAS
jgi:hypothetical protein